MKQIQDLPESLNSNDSDKILIQEESGITKFIKKENLLAGASDGQILNTILYKDSVWKMDIRGNQYTSNFPCFTSMGANGSENSTGILKLGYLVPKTKLHFLVCGGGGTNGILKILKFVDASGVVILSKTLAEISNNSNNDAPVHKVIDTSSIIGQRCYLQFEDNDTNSGWAWWAFVLGSFFVEE